MRFCLAMAFQDESRWLRLHLPVLMKAVGIDGLIALDGGSDDDSAEIVRSYGGVVFYRPFDWNFGAHMNELVRYCEDAQFDVVLRLDPDELMYSADITRTRAMFYTPEVKAVMLPRYNFEEDRTRVWEAPYPDWQIRAWRLNEGVRYTQSVHESLSASIHALGWGEPQLADWHIYHYSGLRRDNPREVDALRLKHINYHRLANNETPLNALPDELRWSQGFKDRVPFIGKQPLDPAIIGKYAPFHAEEVGV